MKQTFRQQYEKFKLQWMLEHGYTLTDFVKILDEIAKESKNNAKESENNDEEGENNESVFKYYYTFESDIGFNGELYPSFHEWFINERNDYAL